MLLASLASALLNLRGTPAAFANARRGHYALASRLLDSQWWWRQSRRGYGSPHHARRMPRYSSVSSEGLPGGSVATAAATASSPTDPVRRQTLPSASRKVLAVLRPEDFRRSQLGRIKGKQLIASVSTHANGTVVSPVCAPRYTRPKPGKLMLKAVKSRQLSPVAFDIKDLRRLRRRAREGTQGLEGVEIVTQPGVLEQLMAFSTYGDESLPENSSSWAFDMPQRRMSVTGSWRDGRQRLLLRSINGSYAKPIVSSWDAFYRVASGSDIDSDWKHRQLWSYTLGDVQVAVVVQLMLLAPEMQGRRFGCGAHLLVSGRSFYLHDARSRRFNVQGYFRTLLRCFDLMIVGLEKSSRLQSVVEATPEQLERRCVPDWLPEIVIGRASAVLQRILDICRGADGPYFIEIYEDRIVVGTDTAEEQ